MLAVGLSDLQKCFHWTFQPKGTLIVEQVFTVTSIISIANDEIN